MRSRAPAVNARREAWLKAPTAAKEETRGGRSGAAELAVTHEPVARALIWEPAS